MSSLQRWATRLIVLLVLLLAACVGAEPDREIEWAPAPADQPCATREDRAIDGSVDVQWRHLYDVDGLHARDEGVWHRTPESVLLVEYDHADGGLLAGLRMYVDDALTVSREYAYDRSGNLTATVADGDGDGSSPAVTTAYGYDDGGMLVAEELDRQTDGVIDRRRGFGYDPSGRVSRVLVDERADQVIDAHWNYAYGARGLLETLEEDAPIGGPAEYRVTSHHDREGRLVLQEGDVGVDGTIESRQTWAFDAEGRMIRQSYDFDGDYADDATMLYTYDAEGRLTELRATGHAPFVWTYEYDCPL